MRSILELVAVRNGYVGPQGDQWVEAVVSKLFVINVLTMKDIVTKSMIINEKLMEIGHIRLHHTTIQAMLDEVADAMVWPGEEE